MEDGFKEFQKNGVHALRSLNNSNLHGSGLLSRQQQRQSRFQERGLRGRVSRGSSEALATKLGPSFHTQPPTKYSFSNDTGNLHNTLGEDLDKWNHARQE